MARHADPERIFMAWRIAVRNSLTDYGMPLDDAERWMTRWEVEAAVRELPRDGDCGPSGRRGSPSRGL
jgi:hypothetical protein